MKTTLRLFAFAVIALVASIAAATGPRVAAPHHDHQQAATVSVGVLADAPKAQRYTCPMHPEVVSDRPGKCPKCGMNLEAVKDAPKK
jgi:hypothetical protein